MVDFDLKFQKLVTQMVEISFEYVGSNKNEVHGIYIFGSMEAGDSFYDVFFNINNNFCEKHEVNDFIIEHKVDVSKKKQIQLLDIGIDILEEIRALFHSDGREVPTLLKMQYFPENSKFTCDISYQLYYSNHDELICNNIFEQWFEDIKNKPSIS